MFGINEWLKISETEKKITHKIKDVKKVTNIKNKSHLSLP